ncbi:MAG: hypothetical protein NC432_12390 [Roseburia sp.]|nr:hypothetical protein [Roseburia sp.]MCM1096474.1 hypothetical protein [Ruminococcus flavefaciens]
MAEGKARESGETYAQRSVRHCLDMIAPFEAAMPQTEEGQWQFYQFMVSLYREMYRDPEKYRVFPKPYEEYIAKRKDQEVQKQKEKEHENDPKESTLRNTFQQAIQFYAVYLYQIGLRSRGLDERSGEMILKKEDYFDIRNQMNRFHDAKYNGERYEVLSELGIQVCDDGDIVRIVHREDRRMMEGIAYLCNAPDSKYKWMNFVRLDFKNAYAPIPTVDDICKTLPARSTEAVKKLEDNLAGMKIKAKIKPLKGIVSDFRWKVEYVYKGKNICGFYADNESFMLCIYFNHFENINEFAKVLQEENGDLFQWFKNQFPERLCKCPSNRRVFFGGEARRICGLSNRAEIVNPDGEDMEKALYLLRKYRKIDL